MSLADILWIATVLGLPILISWRLFSTEPPWRSFIATWTLAVVGSQIVAFVISLATSAIGFGIFGMFDGLVVLPVAAVSAAFMGPWIRRRRHSQIENLPNAPNQ